MEEKVDEVWAEHSLTLTMGEASRKVRLKVATRPQRPVELLPVLQLLQNEIVAVAEEAVEQQGKRISCKAGCGACCRQLVPISEIEARYLAKVVDNMLPNVSALPPGRSRRVACCHAARMAGSSGRTRRPNNWAWTISGWGFLAPSWRMNPAAYTGTDLWPAASSW